ADNVVVRAPDLLEVARTLDHPAVDVVRDARAAGRDGELCRWRVLRADHDVRGQEAPVSDRGQRLALPAGQIVYHLGSGRRGPPRNHASGRDRAPPGVVLEADDEALSFASNREPPAAQREPAATGARERVGELVGAAREDAVAAVMAGDGPVAPGRASLVAPEPERTVEGNL